MWAVDASNVVAVGDNGTIRIYDGLSWNSFISGTSAGFQDVWGTSINDIFVVGLRGVIFHWDGVSWTLMDGGTTVMKVLKVAINVEIDPGLFTEAGLSK